MGERVNQRHEAVGDEDGEGDASGEVAKVADGDGEAADDDAEQQEGDAVDAAADKGKDGETK